MTTPHQSAMAAGTPASPMPPADTHQQACSDCGMDAAEHESTLTTVSVTLAETETE